MNELGIHSILRKKRHGKRGKTSHIAPNLLNRDFTATALNQKWVTDVTEFQVGQEKLYFSPLMDLANREIIAYNFATRPKFSLVKKMLEQDIKKILISHDEIVTAARELGKKLTEDYQGKIRFSRDFKRVSPIYGGIDQTY